MRKLYPLIVAIVALAAAPAWAQKTADPPKPPQGRGPIRGGPNQFIMLRHPEIQKELKLTEEQKTKLKKTMEGMRDKMIEFVENGERDKLAALVQEQAKHLDQLLTPEQIKRLKQVFLQVQGLWGLTEPGIAKDLKITAEQKKKILKLQEESEKQMKQLSEGKASSRKEAQEKLAELHKTANENGLRLMTAEQQAKWKEMAGPPFKGNIQRILPMGR